MIIGVDFDQTIAFNREFPFIGDPVPNALETLHKLNEAKHKIILITNRSNKEGSLQPAVKWLKKHNVDLYAVNNNPSQDSWSDSRKIYADIYIDDRNLGCPLLTDKRGKDYVNWYRVENILRQKGLFK